VTTTVVVSLGDAAGDVVATGPARESDKVPAAKTIARVAAAGTAASMVFAGAELMKSRGNPVTGLVVVGVTGFLAAVLIAGFLIFLSRVFEKSSSRRAQDHLRSVRPGGLRWPDRQ